MSRLHDLFAEQAQSPWLDNLRRDWLDDGTLARWVDRGVRGITSNPTIFEKAVGGTPVYDPQFRSLIADGASIDDAYWALVTTDVARALDALGHLYDVSGGGDGFVSLEVAPDLARDTRATLDSARAHFAELGRPNLLIKIPGTSEGLPAIAAAISEGVNVNVTLLFSLDRYVEVLDAYMTGLEDRVAAGAPIDGVHSVASFFVSRVDTEVDRRLEAIGTGAALALRGRAAVAQAQLAYGWFLECCAADRWKTLADLGARVQRPLWASTSTKNPAYADTLYVDTLIGPDTVNTLPETALEAFDDHGTVARTIDAGLDGARAHLDRLRDVGVDLADVARVLEDEGVAAFVKSFDGLRDTLRAKAAELSG